MNYKLVSFLIAWIFPTKQDRAHFRRFCSELDCRCKLSKVQKHYKKLVKSMKNKNKLKVLFLVNDVAKWKTQSLYNELENSYRFEPVIAVTISGEQRDFSLDDKKSEIENAIAFFNKKGIRNVCAYDLEKDKGVSLKQFNPDIVFYEQPYALTEEQDIRSVLKYAITCYVPYYIANYENLKIDCFDFFHAFLFKFYVYNENLKKIYQEYLMRKQVCSNNICVSGHTTLDEIIKRKQQIHPKSEYVIYAPHWSITDEKNINMVNLATFDKNGLLILDYAKKHPEIKWVFKPHPILRIALEKIGWTRQEINDYYNEWKKIGICCYDSDYLDLFFQSKAMITDSNSFLFEYFFTGKPLVYLKSDNCVNKLSKHMEDIVNTYYVITNNDDLLKALDNVVVKGVDLNKSARFEYLQDLTRNYKSAAQNIMEDLLQTLKQI